MARPKKTAPTVGLVDYSGSDERKELIHRYIPEGVVKRDPKTGEKIDPELHVMVGDETMPDSHYTSQGYTVRTKPGGEKLQLKGSTFFTIPYAQHKAAMNRHGELAVAERDSAIRGDTANGPLPLAEEKREGD